MLGTVYSAPHPKTTSKKHARDYKSYFRVFSIGTKGYR